MTGSHLLSLNSYHYRRGGSDVVYLDHAGLFQEMGWRNTFFSMHHPKNMETADGTHFARMVDYEFAEKPGQKIRAALASIYNAEARARAKDLVARERFDVAHVHCIYHHLTPSVFPVLARAGVPIVLTAHDLKIACPNYKMMNQTGICEACKGGNYANVIKYRCIKGSFAASALVAAEAVLHKKILDSYQHVSRIVTPSRFYRDKIIEWGIPAEKVVYVPNFTRIVDPVLTEGYDGALLFFGRLSEEKGIATLIEASRRSGVPVDIAGSGPLEAELKAEAARTGAPVRFLDRLDGDTLWRTVGRARAIVLPSEWYENAPMSVLEAFQLERPVIGAEIGGIPELVRPEGHDCGWLFPSGDAEALAACLSKAQAASEATLREKGRSGRSLALGPFSRERYYETMMDVYRDAGLRSGSP